MCQLHLFETLCLQNGELLRLPSHEKRRLDACRHFWPGRPVTPLRDILAAHGIHEHGNAGVLSAGTFKVHIDYSREDSSVTVTPYTPKHVESLRLVTADDIDYAYKYADRTPLAACLSRRGSCDDVIIVRNGLLTDTSYSNIALFDGTSWLTPRHPLLMGTMRAALLDSGLLHEADIRPADLPSFTTVSLINAMLPLGRLTVSTGRIEH